MEMRVKDTKSFRTQYRRFDNLTKNQFDTQFQYLSEKYQNDPAALYELDVLCEEAFMDAELFEKEYLSILERVGEVFFINNMNTRSLDLFKKLIGLKPFMKRVLRDFFRAQSAEKKAIHDLYKFIIQNQFRVNKTQCKFYLSFISSIFFFNYNPENLKAIDLKKKIFIDASEVEIPFQRILDRIHENLNYFEKDEPNFGLVEKEQARNTFAQNKFADFDLKNQVKDSNDIDDVNPSEEKILDDDFLREVNKKDDEINDEMKLPEDEEEEEKKENKNEQKKENKKEIIRLDSQSDEEVKRKDEEEPNFDNSLTLDLENIKDASSFLDEKKNVAQTNENNKIKENPKKIENLKEHPKTIETNTLHEIKKKLGDEQPGIINECNVVSKSEIAIADYMIDFIIPKGKMISRSVKNIEIVRGKFTLFCDHCLMPKLENIIKRSKIKGIRECITCCNYCGTNIDETDGKEKNTDELQSVDFKKNSMVEDKKEIPPKEAQTLEQLISNVGKKSLSNLPKYELKAFFRMTIIPKKKPTDPMSFCRIYTENSFFWISKNSNYSKKLKKKPVPIQRDPRTGRPLIKPKIQEDDKDFGKLFQNIFFQFTCECDLKYEHKGLPLGNENSFQKQCDKCWSSMIFQINEIEVKILEPTEYDAGSETFLRDRFFV